MRKPVFIVIVLLRDTGKTPAANLENIDPLIDNGIPV
jgi:hypothetical protein